MSERRGNGVVLATMFMLFSMIQFLLNFAGSMGVALQLEYVTVFGLHIGTSYAEGFKTFRISGYMPDYKVLPQGVRGERKETYFKQRRRA